jgi:hypothetical protein
MARAMFFVIPWAGGANARGVIQVVSRELAHHFSALSDRRKAMNFNEVVRRVAVTTVR